MLLKQIMFLATDVFQVNQYTYYENDQNLIRW